MTSQYKLHFSIFGGNLYESNLNEHGVLDAFQIPLSKKPKSSCRSCYGRFYTAYDVTQRHFVICKKCAKMCIDVDALLSKRNGKRK